MPPANRSEAATSRASSRPPGGRAGLLSAEMAVPVEDRELVALRAAVQVAQDGRKALQKQLEDEKWAHAVTERRLAHAVDEAKQLRAELTDRRTSPFATVADNVALKHALADTQLRLEQEQARTAQLAHELLALTSPQLPDPALPAKLVRQLQALRHLLEEQESAMNECENFLGNSCASSHYRLAQLVTSERMLIPPLEQVEEEIQWLQGAMNATTSEDDRAKMAYRMNYMSRRQAELVKKLASVRAQKKSTQAAIARSELKLKKARRALSPRDDNSAPELKRTASTLQVPGTPRAADGTATATGSDDEDDDADGIVTDTPAISPRGSVAANLSDIGSDKKARREDFSGKALAREITQLAKARDDLLSAVAMVMGTRAELLPKAHSIISTMFSILAGGNTAGGDASSEPSAPAAVQLSSTASTAAEAASASAAAGSAATIKYSPSEATLRLELQGAKTALAEHVRHAQDVRDRYLAGIKYLKALSDRSLERERERFARLQADLTEVGADEGKLVVQLSQCEAALNEAKAKLLAAGVADDALPGAAKDAHVATLERNLSAAKNSIAFLGELLDKKHRRLIALEAQLTEQEKRLVDKLGAEALQRAVELIPTGRRALRTASSASTGGGGGGGGGGGAGTLTTSPSIDLLKAADFVSPLGSRLPSPAGADVARSSAAAMPPPSYATAVSATAPAPAAPAPAAATAAPGGLLSWFFG